MNLNDTLTLLALQLQLPPDELIRYAGEDVIGGYSYRAADRKWPMGSLFAEEGQVLYALVRILKPAHVAEIGSLRGCSTAHLATALSVNGSGHITAIDISGGALDMFPKHLDSVLTGITGDGLEWLAGQEDESIDLLFEDSSHGEEMCASIAALCKTKLTPGGVLIVHDAAHTESIDGNGVHTPSPVGAEICAGLDRALGNEYRVYLSEPSDCGFAAWQRKMIWRDGGPTHWNGEYEIELPEKEAVWEGIPVNEGWVDKPKREMITEDGEHLEIVDAPPVEMLPEKKKRGRKPKSQTL